MYNRYFSVSYLRIELSSFQSSSNYMVVGEEEGGGSVGGIMILLFLYYMGSAPAIVYKIPHVDT
jgi:hypothetical protein